jgi:hypothetical protein
MKHIKNAKVTAKIQIREGAQIRVLGGTGSEPGTRYPGSEPVVVSTHITFFLQLVVYCFHVQVRYRYYTRYR